MPPVGSEGIIDEPVNEPTPIDEFSDAFAEANEPNEPKTELTPVTGTETEIPPEPPKEEPLVPADTTPKSDPTPTPTPDTTPPDDATYEQRWKTLQGIWHHDKQTWETERAELIEKLQNAESKAAPPTPQTDKTLATPVEDLTDDQKQAITDYDSEFDVVSKMEGLKRDRALKALESKYEQKFAELEAKLNPTIETVQTVKNQYDQDTVERHFSTIRSAHPDYEDYITDGSIKKWIDSKPAYLQRGMLEAYNQGSAPEVIELFADFKRENNIIPQNPLNPPPTEPPAPKVTENPRTVARKEAITSVDTRPRAINPTVSPKDDYEGAFDEAIHLRS